MAINGYRIISNQNEVFVQFSLNFLKYKFQNYLSFEFKNLIVAW